MDQQTPILAVTQDAASGEFYHQIAAALGYTHANLVIGTPLDAALQLSQAAYSPRYLIIDVGDRRHDVLSELDRLAEYCDISSRVVVLGNTNDIAFYRTLIDKGVLEYLTHPADIGQIRAVLVKTDASATTQEGVIISFIGASAGDGSSTLALNAAYALARDSGKPTILVDLDYQFGIVAKNLDVATSYGIKEIFDHPDRGIDATLVEKMAASYKGVLDVIVAPNPLHMLPSPPPEMIRDLMHALQGKYTYIVLDLPHIWTSWVSTALSGSNHIVLVAQLWLKSVTHASRMLGTWKQLGIRPQSVSVVINRSGSKFKEAVNPKDFERVTGHKIDFYITNDIKTAVKAENEGHTIMELTSSSLANQIQQLTDSLKQHLGDKKAGPVFNSASSVQIPEQQLRRLK